MKTDTDCANYNAHVTRLTRVYSNARIIYSMLKTARKAMQGTPAERKAVRGFPGLKLGEAIDVVIRSVEGRTQ